MVLSIWFSSKGMVKWINSITEIPVGAFFAWTISSLTIVSKDFLNEISALIYFYVIPESLLSDLFDLVELALFMGAGLFLTSPTFWNA